MHNKTSKNSIQTLAITAMFSAIICIIAPWSIFATSLIPISLATFILYITASILPPAKATMSVVVYILLGAIGLPVFSGFSGGMGKILGPTGGYILGYIPMVFIIALLIQLLPKKFMYPIAMILGTAILYTFGTIWFMYQQQVSLAAALSSCVVPFLIGDVVKIVSASLLGITLKKRLIKFLV